MYARTLEDVSKEYGRNGPINVPLFTTAEREWETCRHYIDQEVLKRDKTHCPSCGTKPLIRSSDAIIKLRRLASAGRVRKPQNERVAEELESRFGNLVIKSDVEVEKFRQRIYDKIKTSKKKKMCGGSAFTAAREDSKEQNKYAETGLVLWNPRWTKGLGLTGGEEHEQVFSKLYRYTYVLKLERKYEKAM
ncbi:hypothetical protein DAPPUDRAFT_253071 [Daphnia pulex]|uniref:Uncharacterized protein n=1 Tax=Daphnia pulex TaxID=6669 RepID=E9H442_DAPPU|nr:hypothetical protein DAPPUDRAFT_253071 [Daphnia pulex]|eukprot:EFX73497.1 hypothetical protein DAPPUDRAFT_253071 [Daphnia pulex]